MFGIERPIVQGGLMWVAKAELASAVANAGGIGFMTALSFQEAEDLRAEIRRCRKLTEKPFGVNLTFLPALGTIDYPAYIKVCIEEGIKFKTCRELLDRTMVQAEAIIKEKFVQVIS